MKIEDAVMKWCPHRQGIYLPDADFNGNDIHVPLCIAAACMMWRFHGDDGYCGLAGPETPRGGGA